MKLYTLLFSALLIISCTNNKKASEKLLSEKSGVLNDTTYNAMGAYFSANGTNSIILNWSEAVDTSGTTILKFKIYNTKTNEFGNTITVGPSKGMQAHDESMSKVAKNAKGTLYAVFRMHTPIPENRFAGSIYYSVSNDEGKTWSDKIKLVEDETSISQSFFDIALLPDGELGLSWLDGRKLEKDKDGSSLYFAKSKNNLGFFDEKPIAGSTCQCCRTDLFVAPNNTINVAYRNITEGSIRDMYRTTSIDNGFTFTNPVPMGNDGWKIEGCPHTGPSFAHNSKDLAVTWFTGADSGAGIFFKKLTDEITLYENKTLISSIGKHPQMEALPNADFYIVYEDFYKENDQNYNHIVFHTIKSDGSEIKKNITENRTKNDHAVLSKVNNNQLMVAWTTRDDTKSKIVYATINL